MANEIQKIKNRVTRQVKGTDAQVEAFLGRLDKFLAINLEDILGKLASGEVKGAEAANILGSLMSELEAAGLQKEIGKLRAIYADELRFVRDEFAEQDIDNPLTDADKPMINALIDNSLAQVSNKVTGYGLDVQALTMQHVLTGEAIDLKEIREQSGSKLASQIKTELDTSVMVFQRTVAAAKAEELGLTLFLYVGPDDKITRPFCHKVLNAKTPPIYTAEEIDRLDNGQDTSVKTTGGGYNCRHHWQPVSEERARELGYNGGGE